MSTSPKIGFIGGGHMAGAILEGLAESYPNDSLFVADRNLSKRNYFNNELHIHAHEHFNAFIDQVDIIILAIKPQGFPDLLPELTTHIKNEHLIISVAAGVSIEAIQRGLDKKNQPIIRAMPNIPSLIRLGATALYANHSANEEQKRVSEQIFNACGLTTWIEDESLISSVIAVSGSSPAYFFYMLEVMIEIGIELGLSRENSDVLAKQSMLGAASLCLKSELSVDALKRSVMSPEGTTERAIYSMEKSDFYGLMEKAMQAASNRDKELSKIISDKIK